MVVSAGMAHSCNAYDWISDFLTDRTQTVVLEGEMSSKAPVTSGVPQGKGVDPDTKVGGTAYMSTQREVLEGQTGSHRAK